MPPKISRVVLEGVMVGGWLLAIGAGFWSLHAYESTAGRSGPTRESWPSDSSLLPVSGRPEVIMAVHPRCPCTRASLAALADLVRGSKASVSVRLLIYRPTRSAPDWAGDMGRKAAIAIPGALAVDDPGGVEATRFGLATSGAVAAFDDRGRLRFTGGLNEGRGSVQSSAGAESVMAVLAGRPPELASCDAFGCPMLAPSTAVQEPGSGP